MLLLDYVDKIEKPTIENIRAIYRQSTLNMIILLIWRLNLIAKSIISGLRLWIV